MLNYFLNWNIIINNNSEILYEKENLILIHRRECNYMCLL